MRRSLLVKLLLVIVFKTLNLQGQQYNSSKRLIDKRTNILQTQYYSQLPNQEIKSIVLENSQELSMTGYYNGIMDSTKTKFIAFSACNEQMNCFKSNKDSDHELVTIISKNFCKAEEQLYILAHVIIGIYHESNWYFRKTQITYFYDANFEVGKQRYFNSLQNWNFFKKRSTEINPLFWESYFFYKIESLVIKKSNLIAKYQRQKKRGWNKKKRSFFNLMIKSYYDYDAVNKEYFGLYKIVADQKKKEKNEF